MPQPDETDDRVAAHTHEDTDYDEFYRSAEVPWDIGEPQPALAELVASGWCAGRVLDAGCGTAELALALAERGHEVTGVDGSPTAIERARRKAADRGLDIDLRVGDATELDRIGVTFDTVVDSGLLHCLPPGVQEQYVAALRQICAPGAGVAVLCFADVPGARTPDDKRLTETRLRALFADGWRIESLEPAHLYGLIRDEYGAVSNWPRDERGRTAMTGWLLRARAATERPAGLG